MNLEEILLAISNSTDDELTIKGLAAAQENWSIFYPELERIIDQFIADETSLTDEQKAILFFGTLLLAQLKYYPAFEKCLQLFARSDSYLTPIERVFGDTLTELTATIFFNVANGNTQALSDYIVGGHQAMYCKAAAIEAVFAQFEVGTINKAELSDYVTLWLTAFLALPSNINSFLLSALADSCIEYQLDDFKSQFVGLCDKNNAGESLFDEERFKESEVKAWAHVDVPKLVESGMVKTDFNVINTLHDWIDNDSEDAELNNIINEGADDLDSLMGEGGLLANMLYDENTILENSVPVSSLPTTGRNEPCPCGSGKKYKKCCIR